MLSLRIHKLQLSFINFLFFYCKIVVNIIYLASKCRILNAYSKVPQKSKVATSKRYGSSIYISQVAYYFQPPRKYYALYHIFYLHKFFICSLSSVQVRSLPSYIAITSFDTQQQTIFLSFQLYNGLNFIANLCMTKKKVFEHVMQFKRH